MKRTLAIVALTLFAATISFGAQQQGATTTPQSTNPSTAHASKHHRHHHTSKHSGKHHNAAPKANAQ